MKRLTFIAGMLATGVVCAQGQVPVPEGKVNLQKSGDGYYAEVENTGDTLPILPDVSVMKLVGSGSNKPTKPDPDYDTSFEPLSLSIIIPPGMEQVCDAADSLTCYMVLPGMSAIYGEISDDGSGPFHVDKGTYCINVRDLLTSLPLVKASCPMTLFTVK